MSSLTPQTPHSKVFALNDFMALRASFPQGAGEMARQLMPKYLWAVDEDFKLNFVSPSLTEKLDGLCDLRLGQPLGEWLEPAFNADNLQELKAQLARKDAIIDQIGGKFQSNEGQKLGFMLSAQPFRDDLGAFKGYVGSLSFLPEGDVAQDLGHAAEISENEAMLKELCDTMQAGILIISPDNMISFANDHVRAMLPELAEMLVVGQPIKDVMGAVYDHALVLESDSVAPIEALSREAWIEARLANYRSGRFESVETLASGRRLKLYNRCLDDGTILGLRIDVTELTQKERKLAQEVEKNFLAEEALNAITDPIFVKDQDLRFVMANQAFADMYDQQPTDFYGLRMEELSDSPAIAHYIATEQAVLDTGELLEEEQVFEKDGTTAYHIVRKTRIETRNQRQFMVGRLVDVTKLKHRSQQLDAAREKAQSLNDDLRLMLDNLSIGIVLLDSNHCVTAINNTTYNYWALEVGSVALGTHFGDVLDRLRQTGLHHHDEDEIWVAYKASRLEEIRIGDMAQREITVTNGRIFTYSVLSLTSGQRLISYLDITDTKAREAKLRAAEHHAILADRSKSDFLSSISHEVRAPMNGVMGMAELLAQSDLDARQRTFVDIILKSSTALLTIVDDITDFAQINAGGMELASVAFNLRDVMDDVASVVAPHAREKALPITIEIQPDMPDELVGDERRVRQILTNLLSNAIKYTETGFVKVQILGRKQGEQAFIEFCVEDSGMGIAAERLATLFSPIGAHEQTDNNGSQGFGLAIVASLVSLMDGEVRAESTLGQGSKFTVTLRLDINQDVRLSRIVADDMQGAKVLVLDDDPQAEEALVHQLQRWGFDACLIAQAETASMFLQASATLGTEVDLIISKQKLLDAHLAEKAENDALAVFPKAKTLLISDISTMVDQNIVDLQHYAGCLIQPLRASMLFEKTMDAIANTRLKDTQDQPISHHFIVPPRDEIIVPPRDKVPAENQHNAVEAVVAQPDFPPISPPMATPNLDPENIQENASTRSKKVERMDILIAEDNEINQLIYQQILVETPLHFKIVDNGRDLVQQFDETLPRMVMIDLTLPDMDGTDATHMIRDADALWGSNVPIIGVLAAADDGLIETCIAAGMDDCLMKPISPKALLSKVFFWLEKSRGQKVA